MPRNELLQYWREHYHLTQEQLAEHVGVEPKTEQNWEYRETDPNPKDLQKLTALLGKSARELGFVRKNEYPPIPYLQLDYPRSEFFTGREDILQRLYRQLTRLRPKNRLYFTALVGMGGVGKTHIAVEYAYRHMFEYQMVVFLDASSREKLANNFSNLAYSPFNLAKREAHLEQKVAIQAVKDWLGNFSRYLLIFDNVEDLSTIADFLSFKVKGDVIIITQAQTTGVYAEPINVEPMDKDEGVWFLLRRSKGVGKDIPLQEIPHTYIDSAQEIVDLLVGLPLAIDQAGAYLEGKDLGTALAKYADRFRRESKTLLERRGKHSPPDHPRSVAATLSLALKRINRINPLARELLKFFAFLDPDNIPQELILQNAAVLGPRFQPFVSDQVAFEDAAEDAIDTLRHFSLIQRKVNKDAYSIHKLVQTIVQDEMSEQERRVWVERAVLAVHKVFPKVLLDTLQDCQAYLPAALVCSQLIKQWNILLPEAFLLLLKLGKYYIFQGQYSFAESLLLQTLPSFQTELEQTDNWVFAILINLAYTLERQADLRTAEVWIVWFLEEFCGQYACHLQAKLEAHALLALVLAEAHRFEEARQHFRTVTEMIARELDSAEDSGEDIYPSPFLLVTSARAISYLEEHHQGYEGTEDVLKGIIRMGESMELGNYYLAKFHTNFGAYYIAKERFKEAEEHLPKALELLLDVVGLNSPLEHPDTIAIYYYLAQAYAGMANYEDAISTGEQALTRARKFYGNDSLELLQYLRLLAVIHKGAGNGAEARSLAEEGIALAEEMMGTVEYTLFPRDYYNLGVGYQRLGEKEKAIEAYNKAISLAQENPDGIDILDLDIWAMSQIRLRQITDNS